MRVGGGGGGCVQGCASVHLGGYVGGHARLGARAHLGTPKRAHSRVRAPLGVHAAVDASTNLSVQVYTCARTRLARAHLGVQTATHTNVYLGVHLHVDCTLVRARSSASTLTYKRASGRAQTHALHTCARTLPCKRTPGRAHALCNPPAVCTPRARARCRTADPPPSPLSPQPQPCTRSALHTQEEPQTQPRAARSRAALPPPSPPRGTPVPTLLSARRPNRDLRGTAPNPPPDKPSRQG